MNEVICVKSHSELVTDWSLKLTSDSNAVDRSARLRCRKAASGSLVQLTGFLPEPSAAKVRMAEHTPSRDNPASLDRSDLALPPAQSM